MIVYNIIEGVRNNSNRQITELQKRAKILAHPIPEFAIDHMKISMRGLEVWMCTLGAGISPALRDEARTIWGHLAQGYTALGEVIDTLREYELRSSAAFGHTDSMPFHAISGREWVELCSFRPAVFSKSLTL